MESSAPIENVQAVAFAGQGTQRLGMGKDIHSLFPEIRAIYERASDAFIVARLKKEASLVVGISPQQVLGRFFRQAGVPSFTISDQRSIMKYFGNKNT